MKNQTGQIGIVVLLIMTTMLTVGIGAITRSTQDLRITRQELEASELFNAAEAGIEAALADIDTGSPPTDPQSIQVNDAEVTYVAEEIRNLNFIAQENNFFFVDVARSSAGPSGYDLVIEWAQSYASLNCTTDDPESIEVMVISTPPDPAIISAYSRCERNDGFSPAPSGSITVALDSNDVLVGIRTIYGDGEIRVQASGTSAWSLPVQGYQIRSSATKADTDDTKVVVLDKYNEMPVSLLGYSVFSGTTILMN